MRDYYELRMVLTIIKNQSSSFSFSKYCSYGTLINSSIQYLWSLGSLFVGFILVKLLRYDYLLLCGQASNWIDTPRYISLNIEKLE